MFYRPKRELFRKRAIASRYQKPWKQWLYLSFISSFPFAAQPPGYPPYQILRFCAFEGAPVFSRPAHRDLTRPWGQADGLESVTELLVSVLGHGLGIMAVLTKRLPVAPIPEQFLVTTMGNDVVNHRCFDILPTGKASYTQRMGLKEGFAFPLPSAAVPTPASRACHLRVQ